MPLNTGDRLFPSGGSPGGGGGSTGGPFQPTVQSSINLTGLTVQEAQYSKSSKVVTVVGWMEATVTAAIPTNVEIDLPEPADNSYTVTGVLYVGNNVVSSYVRGTSGGALLEWTAPASGSIIISYQITYKSAA